LEAIILLSIEVKRFEENMLSFCTTHEVACQDVLRQGMLWNGKEFFQVLQIVLYFKSSIPIHPKFPYFLPFHLPDFIYTS